MKKSKSIVLIALAAITVSCLCAFTLTSSSFSENSKDSWKREKGNIENINGEISPRIDACAFQTLMGNETIENNMQFKTPENIMNAVSNGLMFLVKDQNCDGGWSAVKGAYYNDSFLNNGKRKNNSKEKKANSDAATTAMVSMAILRSGSDLQKGDFSLQLKNALEYLLNAVENTKASDLNIPTVTSTQIQGKLGSNIDCVLTAQFLGNIVDKTKHNDDLNKRVKKNLEVCTKKIQQAQNEDGSIQGQGWAGVLQSGFANSALETAMNKGIEIDLDKFEKSKAYQIGNYDTKSGNVKTDRGAGVVLYSVSGSVRASAKDARKVEKDVKKAQEEGKLAKNEVVSPSALKAIGYTDDEASRYATSYTVNKEAKDMAQREDVLTGYGNNGGEEFLSFLQTGESLIINGDEGWKKWFDNTSGSLLKIQNEDGSWNGHHCITSPSFCTATCLLILSIENDLEELMALGKE